MDEKNSESDNLGNLTRFEVIAKYEEIRKKQRQLYSQLMKAEIELRECGEVAKILRDCSPQRKCCRVMSDVLIESDVGSMFPLFSKEKARVEAHLEKLQEDIHHCAEELKIFQKNVQLTFRTELGKEVLDI